MPLPLSKAPLLWRKPATSQHSRRRWEPAPPLTAARAVRRCHPRRHSVVRRRHPRRARRRPAHPALHSRAAPAACYYCPRRPSLPSVLPLRPLPPTACHCRAPKLPTPRVTAARRHLLLEGHSAAAAKACCSQPVSRCPREPNTTANATPGGCYCTLPARPGLVHPLPALASHRCTATAARDSQQVSLRYYAHYPNCIFVSTAHAFCYFFSFLFVHRSIPIFKASRGAGKSCAPPRLASCDKVSQTFCEDIERRIKCRRVESIEYSSCKDMERRTKRRRVESIDAFISHAGPDKFLLHVVSSTN